MEAEQEKQFVIAENTVKSLLAYMQEKPFKEVAGGISALSQLKEIKLQEKVPSTDILSSTNSEAKRA